MSMLRCCTLVVLFVVISSAAARSSGLTTRTKKSLIEDLTDALRERVLENKLKRLLHLKRDQDKDDVRSAIEDYMDNLCKTKSRLGDFFTPDVKANFGGQLYTFDEIEKGFETMAAESESCFIENYKVRRIQIEGDSAIALVDETEEDEVDAVHKGDEVKVNGVEMEAEDQDIKDQVALELVKQKNGKWLISVALYYVEDKTILDKK